MKYIIFILGVLVLLALIAPRRFPRLLRRIGRLFGDTARMGREIATGEEVEGSPLARYEAQAGALLEEKILREHRLTADPELSMRVGAIGERLARHARRRQIPYRFRVIDAPEPNAFAVPGGAVFVTSALVALCGEAPAGASATEGLEHAGSARPSDLLSEGARPAEALPDDSLAGVIGHEIIHIDRGHAIRNTAAAFALQSGVRLLLLGKGLLLSRIAASVESMLVQGYRQDQEFEADLFGSRIATLAGFHPGGLSRLLRHLRAYAPEEKGPLSQVAQYFQSHPPVDERLAKLRAAGR